MAGCEKLCPEAEKDILYDTIPIYDTIPVYDTIPFYDTIIPPVELHLGDYYKGGIIFYLDETEQHGLIAAETDLVYSFQDKFDWGSTTQLIGADSEDDGRNNTEIMMQYSSGTSAGAPFKNLVIKGYSDWYIPAKNQLILLKTNANYLQGWHTNSDEAKYWSSTELSLDKAYALNMVALMGTTVTKHYAYRIRPIREF